MAFGFEGDVVEVSNLSPDTVRAVLADLSRSGDEPALRTEDMLGGLAETVLRHGGDILAIDRIRMPTESGAAALFRYA